MQNEQSVAENIMNIVSKREVLLHEKILLHGEVFNKICLHQKGNKTAQERSQM